MSSYGRQAIVFATLLFCVLNVRTVHCLQSRSSPAAEEAQNAKADEIADRIFDQVLKLRLAVHAAQ